MLDDSLYLLHEQNARSRVKESLQRTEGQETDKVRHTGGAGSIYGAGRWGEGGAHTREQAQQEAGAGIGGGAGRQREQGPNNRHDQTAARGSSRGGFPETLLRNAFRAQAELLCGWHRCRRRCNAVGLGAPVSRRSWTAARTWTLRSDLFTESPAACCIDIAISSCNGPRVAQRAAVEKGCPTQVHFAAHLGLDDASNRAGWCQHVSIGTATVGRCTPGPRQAPASRPGPSI